MKTISKYFMFAAAALLCSLSLTSCSKETSNQAGEDDSSSSVCFAYSIFAIEGDLPDVKSSTGTSYADFVAKIKTGELVAPFYSLTLTNKSSGENISVSGNWAEKKKVTLRNGTYKVSGTSTAEGRTLQDKCSIKIDDEITVPSASGEVVLKASYDCFLLVFGDNSVSAMSLFDGEQSSDFFKMGDSFYAFGRGPLAVSGKEKDAYISCTRSDGSSFNISTENMTPTTGKYYVYGEINSDEGFSFEIEDMEPGIPGEEVSVSLDRTTLSLIAGEEVTLKATVQPENASGGIVVWSSSNPSVATVDQGGKVKALAAGNTSITASLGNASAKCDVSVSSQGNMIITGDAESITVTSAVLYGVCKYSWSYSLEFGIEYSKTDIALDAVSLKANGMDSNYSFCCSLDDLKVNTLYYYRAYALVDGVRYYGQTKTFTTKNRQITSSAENVAKYTATLRSECEMPFGQAWYQFSFFYSDTYSTLEELVSNGTEARADSPTYQTSFSSNLSGLKPNTKYYFVPRAIIWGENFYGEVKSFTTNPSDNPAIEVVDLGLSVNWRGWNVGANNPVEYGDYYAWGETRYGNPRFNWSEYEFGGNIYEAPEKYNPSDKKTVLEPGDDVASLRLGGKWRMPTEAEWTELITNCTCVWVDNYDGVGINGLLFTAENGNSIFLPAAGHGEHVMSGRLNAGTEGKYWSSTLDSTGVADWAPVGCNAWGVQFDVQNTAKLSSVSRCVGYVVRPVCEK